LNESVESILKDVCIIPLIRGSRYSATNVSPGDLAVFVRIRRCEYGFNISWNLDTAVDVMNEGIDVPDVNILVFLRATHSRKIFVQQLGRGLRLA